MNKELIVRETRSTLNSTSLIQIKPEIWIFKLNWKFKWNSFEHSDLKRFYGACMVSYNSDLKRVNSPFRTHKKSKKNKQGSNFCIISEFLQLNKIVYREQYIPLEYDFVYKYQKSQKLRPAMILCSILEGKTLKFTLAKISSYTVYQWQWRRSRTSKSWDFLSASILGA